MKYNARVVFSFSEEDESWHLSLVFVYAGKQTKVGCVCNLCMWAAEYRSAGGLEWVRYDLCRPPAAPRDHVCITLSSSRRRCHSPTEGSTCAPLCADRYLRNSGCNTDSANGSRRVANSSRSVANRSGASQDVIVSRHTTSQ